MTNRIRNIQVTEARLDAVEAEVWVTVYPERLASATQAQGRLVGPSCVYRSTVEVAYPLREISRQYESEGTPRITLRGVVPEVCFWDPAAPFLYQGTVELREPGGPSDPRQILLGFRTLGLTPGGLWWNGRPVVIDGTEWRGYPEPVLREIHQAGHNTLLAPVTAEIAGLWDVADRLGFLVLGRLNSRADVAVAQALQQHASCLGWALTAEFCNDDMVRAGIVFSVLDTRKHLVGAELTREAPASLPEGISFVFCREELLPALDQMTLPKIVLRRPGRKGESAVPGLLGWVEEVPEA